MAGTSEAQHQARISLDHEALRANVVAAVEADPRTRTDLATAMFPELAAGAALRTLGHMCRGERLLARNISRLAAATGRETWSFYVR